MDMPLEIKKYIEDELNKINKKELINNAQKISLNYRQNNRNEKKAVTKQDEALAYAISRMPATFGAVSNSLEKTLEIYSPEIKSLADIGAGTGSASIATNTIINPQTIKCFEKENAMINMGKDIFKKIDNLQEKVEWNKFDINVEKIDEKFDLVISSYMINEIEKSNFEEVIKKLWDVTEKILIIVEPGTMQGYHNIMKAKEILISLGANILAPCMGKKCKLPENDWCNFSCRIQRSKIHKELKNGDSPFEDEKYIYIAVSRKEILQENRQRIIRHPLKYNGFIKLKICDKEEIKEITITRKEKEKFKIARKSNTGDLL